MSVTANLIHASFGVLAIWLALLITDRLWLRVSSSSTNLRDKVVRGIEAIGIVLLGVAMVVSFDAHAVPADPYAWGKAERYETGASASQTTSELYDPVTGRTTAMRVGDWVGQNAHILSQTYGWDTVGNLTDRSDRYDATNTLSENFGYDALNRLTSYQTSSAGIAGLSKEVTLAYNAIGNITSKSDVGTYNYLPSGPNSVRPGAVDNITAAAGQGNRTYTYDAAGNLTSSGGGKYNSITPTSFNLPASMTGSGVNYVWKYGPDHERVREEKGSRATWIVHPDNQGGLSFERDVYASVNRHYVQVMGRTIAMFETTGTIGSSEATNNLTGVQWWHSDHLGSVVAITNDRLQLAQRFSYDPFGKRRQINGSYDATGTLQYDHPNSTDRGFTGHEHLDDVGVIHMNGRTYDPHIGRFMQADPVIQEPNNAQNYNRFSYVLNNPLNATDPSGYFTLKKLLCPICVKEWRKTIVAIGVAYFTGQWIGAYTGSAIAGGAAGGFAQGMIMGNGNIEAGMRGAFTGTMFALAGGVGLEADSFARYGAHAAAGCVSGAMDGNGCGRGAASAVAGKWGTNASDGNAVAAVVAGGTASVIGGGKFENGAGTAAFGYLFNHVLSRGAQLVQQAWGRLQVLVGSPTGQLATEMIAGEIGAAPVSSNPRALFEKAVSKGMPLVENGVTRGFVSFSNDVTVLVRRDFDQFSHGQGNHWNLQVFGRDNREISNIHYYVDSRGNPLSAWDSRGAWNGGRKYVFPAHEHIPK